MNLNGELIARYPLPPPNNTIVTNRIWRDYVTNALELTNRSVGEVYCSRIYQSLEDHHWKFGLTTVIWDESRPVGLLTLMVNTGSAEERLGLPPMDQQVEVLGLLDRTNAGAPTPPNDEYVAFLRSGLTNGTPLGPYRLVEFKRRSDYYLDQFASATNRGRVMIGVATEAIPGTHYRVIVKSPAVVWPWASFKGFLGLVILAGLALFVRALRRRTHAAGITK